MTPPHATDRIHQVPIDLIRPGTSQARRYFDPQRIAELAESIRESGVVQPVVLRGIDGGYELLAGERRWRAAQRAGLHEIPAVVRNDLSDAEAMVLGLIENLQRESLTPMEAAAGLRELGELFTLTHDQIGERIGKSRAYVSNHLRLLKLAPPVQVLVNEGHLSLGHAKILAGLLPVDQIHWAGEVASGNLSVRALEKRLARRDTRKRRRPASGGDFTTLEREIGDRLATSVKLKSEGAGKGELRIRFHSLDELDGILERLGIGD